MLFDTKYTKVDLHTAQGQIKMQFSHLSDDNFIVPYKWHGLYVGNYWLYLNSWACVFVHKTEVQYAYKHTVIIPSNT